MAPSRAQAGFTLIELVVVLLILGLATGLVLPAVSRSVETVELRAQVAGFSAFLRYGRAQAITKRFAHEVRVEPEVPELTLFAAGSETPKARKRLSPRIRFSADPPGARVVTFWPLGFSNGATFRLEAQSGQTYKVTVDPITGRVSTHREAG
ncbi:MAG: prepilin-type N-terminal cleavage/methylation domain-containing protein [Candidatus Methylomirabilia bacterium]